MKPLKSTNLLLMAAILIATTLPAQGDEALTEPMPMPKPIPIVIKEPEDNPNGDKEHEPQIPKTLPPVTVTPITRPPPGPIPKTVLCSNERKEQVSSLIACLKFPNKVQKDRVRGCNRKFTKNWKRLSKNKPKTPAICPAEPPADAITDLVPICRKASLDSKECQILAGTLLKLSIVEKEEETITCTDDGKICPGGKVVYRDPDNNCEFSECPKPKPCTQDVRQCPDGSYVGRDSFNDCAFKPCPKCCDPFVLTGCQHGERGCCTDGSWVCPDESGQYLCDGFATVKPKGKECTCPCSSYTESVTANDELTDDSCRDMSRPILYIKQEEQSFPLGTFASIDEDGLNGDCALGDGVLRISGGEAKVCVKEIADRCEDLGNPIPGREGPYY